MADPKPQSAAAGAGELQAILQRDFPGYMNLLNSQVLPQAQTELGAAKAVSPEYNELLTSLYEKYAPRLAKTGSEIETASRKAGAETDIDILRKMEATDRANNPEYYKTRAATSGKLGELLGSINLGAPNVEAERLVSQEAARTGNLVTPSATSTVSNALSFGNELQKRRDALGRAIGAATSFLQPATSPFTTAAASLTTRPGTNLGESRFTGITAPGQTAYGLGQGLLGTQAGLKQQEAELKAQRRDALDRFNETIGSLPNVSI